MSGECARSKRRGIGKLRPKQSSKLGNPLQRPIPRPSRRILYPLLQVSRHILFRARFSPRSMRRLLLLLPKLRRLRGRASHPSRAHIPRRLTRKLGSRNSLSNLLSHLGRWRSRTQQRRLLVAGQVISSNLLCITLNHQRLCRLWAELTHRASLVWAGCPPTHRVSQQWVAGLFRLICRCTLPIQGC